MLMRCVALLGLLCLAQPALADKPAAAHPAQVAKADTPRTTPGGTQYVLPAGWSASVSGAKVTLSPPEAGSQAVLVDVKASDADAAVAKAWQLYAPAKTWPLEVATDSAPRDS